MTRLHLIRMVDTGRETFGRLYDDAGDQICYTLEKPWRDNHRNISCIPAISYNVRTTESHRFQKPLFEVVNVPRRSGIRIHPANWQADLEGCIAPGEAVGYPGDQIGVYRSRDAYARIHSVVGDGEWQLHIVDFSTRHEPWASFAESSEAPSR